jgi:hypothetical protein
MNDYTTQLLAAGRTRDRVDEADRERLAHVARGARTKTPLIARIAAAFTGATANGRRQAAECTTGAPAS